MQPFDGPGGAAGVDEGAQVDRAHVHAGVGVVAREQLGPGGVGLARDRGGGADGDHGRRGRGARR